MRIKDREVNEKPKLFSKAPMNTSVLLLVTVLAVLVFFSFVYGIGYVNGRNKALAEEQSVPVESSEIEETLPVLNKFTLTQDGIVSEPTVKSYKFNDETLSILIEVPNISEKEAIMATKEDYPSKIGCSNVIRFIYSASNYPEQADAFSDDWLTSDVICFGDARPHWDLSTIDPERTIWLKPPNAEEGEYLDPEYVSAKRLVDCWNKDTQTMLLDVEIAYYWEHLDITKPVYINLVKIEESFSIIYDSDAELFNFDYSYSEMKDIGTICDKFSSL